MSSLCASCHLARDSLAIVDACPSQSYISLQATLEAAQEAMMEQAEEMRKLTAERDALRLHILAQPQMSASSTAGATEDHSMIAAAYDTDRKGSRPLSSECEHLPCVALRLECTIQKHFSACD